MQLIAALQIFAKYVPVGEYCTHCEHDELMIVVDPTIVSDEDIKELEELGFRPDYDMPNFVSTKFGSC
jgi:hypothetical protein